MGIQLLSFTRTCFGHSLSIIITGQLPLYYGKKNSKSNLRTLLGWLEYFVAPPANTRAQQRLQTLWGRRGLWGKAWRGEAWCGAWLVGKVWFVGEGVACGARVPRHQSWFLLHLSDLDRCYVELCPPVIHMFTSSPPLPYLEIGW